MSPQSPKKPNVEGVLLVVGLDVASLATSAHKAGYRVQVADFFGDLDVQAVTERSLSLVRQVPSRPCSRISRAFSAEGLAALARRMAGTCSFDGILLSSGLEDSPKALKALEDIAPILGSTSEIIARVRDRRRFFESLERYGIPYPRTCPVSSPSEAARAARELGYPIVAKANGGFGGANVRLVRSEKGLARILHAWGEILVQKYVRGVAASTSIIGTSNGSVTLTVNRQLLGLRSLGSPGRFSYCGNVVPLDASEALLSRCRDVSARVAEAFGLVGSNGVDLVIDGSGRPWVIEVNPRFQGTLECVERVLGMNLVEVHMGACREGRLPVLGGRDGYCIRLILYGRERSVVPDLRLFPEARDIPVPGVVVEKGEPLCSVVVKDGSSGSALLRGFEVAEAVYSSLYRCED